MIRRFHEAKEKNLAEVCIWGTGKPRRELLHADDLAEGLLQFAAVEDPPDWVNLGSGVDQTILELAKIVKNVVGFDGRNQK